jgi:hypothetical protein
LKRGWILVSSIWVVIIVAFLGAIVIAFDSSPRDKSSEEDKASSFGGKKHTEKNSGIQSDGNNNWFSNIIEIFKTYLQAHRANKSKEAPQDRAARRTANATVWIAFFTAAVIVVGYWQYGVIKGQLDVMADDQRPWAKIEVSTEGLPLPFDPIHGVTAIPYIPKITNVGRLPLFNEKNRAWAFVPSATSGDPIAQWARDCDAFRSLKEESDWDHGRVLFPGDSTGNEEYGTTGPIPGISRTVLNNVPIGADGKRQINIYVYGCVNYTFAPDGGKVHQTGFLFRLAHETDAGFLDSRFDISEILPPSKIRYIHGPGGGMRAD